MMSVWRIAKGITYTIGVIFLFLFKEELLTHIHFLIGGLICVYGLETVILHFVLKKEFDHNGSFYWGCAELIIGVTLLLKIRTPETVYVTWAIWSILREADDIHEQVILWHKGIHTPIDTLESIAAIVLSVMLIITPTREHADKHIYLLMFELIVTATSPFISQIQLFIEDKIQKKS